jgi:predicted nicotinamide N-methyase
VAMAAEQLDTLRVSLEGEIRRLRGPHAPPPPPALLDIAIETVPLPGGDAAVVRPRDWGDLREEEALDKRPVPYWGILWPAGRVLAAEVAEERLAGLRVLELGCGLALPSVAAARAGAAVLATDGSSDAVAFAGHVLALNDVRGDVAQVDWETDGAALAARGPFDLVLAADVLYTQAKVDLVLDMLPALLSPGGAIMLADPGRAGGTSFLAAARQRWETTVVTREDITVARLRARPSASG